MTELDWIDRFDRIADDGLAEALPAALAPRADGRFTPPGALAVALLAALPDSADPRGSVRLQLANALRGSGACDPVEAEPLWADVFAFAERTAAGLGYNTLTSAGMLACLAGFPGFTCPADRRMQEQLIAHGVAPIRPPDSPPDADTRYASLGYGIDLTRRAASLLQCPVVGREEEFEQIIEDLAGGLSPILTGPAGVGKTALVEGLAWKLARTTGVLANALPSRVVAVQVGDLIAGTSQQGALEKRLREFVEHLSASKESVVAFIDEIHSLLAGGAANRVVAEELKPALASGRVRLIGATTEREYQRYFLTDPALRRRFSEVRVREPSPAQAEEILAKLGPRALPSALRGRGLNVTREAAAAAVRVSVDHFKEDHLPARPLKLLQRAAAGRLLRAGSEETKIDLLAADVFSAAAKELGVEPDVLAGGVSAQLSRLSTCLRRELVGQAEAVLAILRGMTLACSGLGDPVRPRAVLLFDGPEGVGKSVACRAVAEAACGSPDSVLVLNMRDFADDQGVSKFRGSGPGYRDSGETWTLYSQVRSRPATVVVLDSLVPLPASMHGPLADVLSGRASDGMGRPTDFAGCIFVVVSAPDTGSDPDSLATAIGRRAAGLVRTTVPFGDLGEADLTEIARREILRRRDRAAGGPAAAALDTLSPENAARASVGAGGTGRTVVAALESALEAELFKRVSPDLLPTTEANHADR